MICGGFWLFAFRSLEDLPGREALERASSGDAATAPDPTASAPGDPGAPRQTAAASPRTAVVETDDAAAAARGVRYVEQAGIVSPRPDGPLVREEVTVELPPPPEPEPTLHQLVVIESAGIVNVRSHRLKLAHIEAPAADETCPSEAGGSWPCGTRARTALRRLVRRRALECLELGEEVSDDPVREARCTVAGTNLAEWLLEMGWARPDADAPEAYRTLHQAAVENGRGLFSANGR